MVEIGAGGGSLAHVDAMGRITVGPESAGAEPGPACYGRGGIHPTVTDADLILGRIDPARFAAGRMPLDGAKAAAALQADIGSGLGLSATLAGYGVAEIVDENMANAARVHSVERGKVIAEHTLIAFGGAAPLHAARLAEKLGIARIIVPPNAGVGSAVGFLRAPIAFEVVRSRHMRLSAFDPAAANAIIAEMRAEALEVVRAGAGSASLIEPRAAFMRYVGQGHEIVVPLPARDLAAEDAALLREAFQREYVVLFSRTIPDAEVEILTWSLTVSTEPERAADGERRRCCRYAAGSRALPSLRSRDREFHGGASLLASRPRSRCPALRPRSHRRGRYHYLRHRRLRRRRQRPRLHRSGAA